MADRRPDDTPLAPRRTLSGSPAGTPASASNKPASNKPTSNKPGSNNPVSNNPVSNKPASGSSSARPAATSGKSDDSARRPVAERLSERVSGAVSSATESVRQATEQRRNDHPSGSSTRTTTPAARPGTAPHRVRKARLRMTHIDPWSVMKTSFLLSVAFGIVTVIAVAVVWSVLGAAGVWDSINQTVQEVIGGNSGSSFDVENYIGTSRVMGFTMIVAVVDVVLITAIATLSAFLYNLAATLLGGLEVTLAEDER
jgi:hypothetical protein